MKYKAIQNQVFDDTGKQLAVVVASNCTKKEARTMAGYIVAALNGRNRDAVAAKASCTMEMYSFPSLVDGWSCSKCGAIYEDTGSFCDKTTHCPGCGAKVAKWEGDDIARRLGHELEDE